MPELLSQSDFRAVRRLPFCYLCGTSFSPVEKCTRDHIPPQSVFAKEDHNVPLILMTHYECNHEQKEYDEIIGQLVAVIHGRYPNERNLKLRADVVDMPDHDIPFLAIRGIRLHFVVWRWIRAFHAALYGEFLPDDTMLAFHSPMPQGKNNNGEYVITEHLKQHALFVSVIHRNRAACTLDRIVCNNSKCVYECAWDQLDNGRSICIFALQVYDWKRLGDSAHFASRGCVGLYRPVAGRPSNATRGTRLEFPLRGVDLLDPFEC